MHETAAAEPDGVPPPVSGELSLESRVDNELRQYLEADVTRLGDVYRGLERGLTAEEIADELDVSTSNFVWNYGKIIAALLERDLPTAPVVTLNVVRRYRSLLKKGTWSTEARARLEQDLEVMESRAGDADALAAESEAARQQTEAAEEAARTGIYVYALPHYLRFPFDPESGRTLLKVGRSDRDIMQRLREQTRTTALPEEPVLLRVYPTGEDDTAEIEAKMHRTLRAFDHGRSAQRMAGREWFLSTTTALDALADLMGLVIEVVNDDADFLDE